ncbi:MAG: redoxin domain-containing protein [Deltaproteobacteria bacterium]|nr:redoxin domain-containing protein [Deltaproteobacteria bacterium]
MEKQTLLITIFSFVLLFFSSTGQAQLGPADGESLDPVDLNRVAVGSLAPDFTLEDSDGKRVTLSSFRNAKSVVLVFYRGHW